MVMLNGALYMGPAISNEHLHLVNQTEVAGFMSAARKSLPLVNSPSHDPLLEKSRGSPTSESVLPQSQGNILWRQPGASWMDLFVCGPVITNTDLGIHVDALMSGERIVRMDQATFGALKMK
jgi:hypothetical protein